MINVTRTESVKSSVKPYPKLMSHVSNGLIVLFRCKSEGTVVCSGDSTHAQFSYSNHWQMVAFHDYNFALEIQND